ncbi:MAG: diguanylate cyclase [Myxococcota bacterium]
MSRGTSSVALPPVAQRALRGKLVTWVVVASLLTVVPVAGLWLWSSLARERSSFELAAELRHALAARTLERALEEALAEAAAAALDPALADSAAAALDSQPGGAPAAGPPQPALLQARGRSERLESMVLLDGRGIPVTWSGDDPALVDLVSLLQPQNATDSELSRVMRGVQLRKELSAATAPETRVLVLDGVSRPVAGAPVRDADGAVSGSLLCLIRLEALATALAAAGLPEGTRLRLLDANGEQVALAGPVEGRWEGSWSHAGGVWQAAGWTLVFEQQAITRLRPVALAVGLSLALALVLAPLLGLLAFVDGSRHVRPLWELYLGIRRARSGEELELSPPKLSGEAESLVLAFNETLRQLGAKRATLERELLALRGQNIAFQSHRRTLAQLTVTDPLTRLANRRSFEEQLQREIKRLSRHQEGLSLLVVDIDDFKKINDELGHAAGDEFLVQIARILKEMARETDVVARYGGEEFVIIAPGTDPEGARVLGERVRTAVAEASFIVEETKRPRKATISIGVATYKGSQTGLFNAADAALYQAKSAGKNCVEMAEE